MEKYTKAQMEVIEFEAEDVITTSSIPTIQFFCWTRRPAHWTKQQPFDC